MLEAKIVCDKNFKIGNIDPRLYGSFLEHMGRVIYTGVYEPENLSSDDEGFRGDVLEKVREMGVTSVRYPGGELCLCLPLGRWCWPEGEQAKEA